MRFVSPNLRVAIVGLANVVIWIGLLAFGYGFFPYKPMFSGLAEKDTLAAHDVPVPFDKVIFMVIDALRSDFVFSEASEFHFTHKLISEGAAIPFTANARSPTVTMPRLKALTTGSIPSFLDVILNVIEGDQSSSLATQDNWVLQMKAKQTGELIMFGDDTWLKLFPGVFDRNDGTSSFFVADFTIVDNNVTRHIPDELCNEGWSTMVLHYLGLDHIGHKSGPNSVNMGPKQREMDKIVKDIYMALEQQPHLNSTLFVFCGDHGMNEAGNHGAASVGETSPAMVFVSPKFKTLLTSSRQAPLPWRDDFAYYDRMEQSDLIPTLASLLGFPIPKNSLGTVMPQFLPIWGTSYEREVILKRNLNQMLKVITAAYGPELFNASDKDRCTDLSSDIKKLACQWQQLSPGDTGTDRQWEYLAFHALRDAQSLMASMASKFDTSKILWGLAISVGATLLGLTVLFMHSESTQNVSVVVFGILHGISTFSSTFIEEEHQLWYWMLSSLVPFLARDLRVSKKYVWRVYTCGVFFAATLLRLLRAYNQTGQKFAGGDDIVSLFLIVGPWPLWSFNLDTFTLLLWRMWPFTESTIQNSIIRHYKKAVLLGTLYLLFVFKFRSTELDSPELTLGSYVSWICWTVPQIPLVDLARLCSLGIMLLSFSVLRHPRLKNRALSFHHLLTLVLLLQTKGVNIPLILINDLLFILIDYIRLQATTITLVTMILQYATFFAFGRTNSISSIDLSCGYTGLRSYNVVIVGILTYISNFAGPIYWASARGVMLAHNQASQCHASLSSYQRHVVVSSTVVFISVTAVLFSCWHFRNHLFIWTVFSPKLLYTGAWLVTHLLLNLGLTGIVYKIGVEYPPIGNQQSGYK